MLSSALLLLVGLLAGATRSPQDRLSIFSDLTPAELRAVRDFLLGRPELRLRAGPPQSLAENSLFLVELLAPPKRHALPYLEAGGRRPRRQARAVVFFGGEARPNVTEYVVWPLPAPSAYRPRGKAAPFAARPMAQLELALLIGRLEESLAPLRGFLEEASGFAFGGDCGARCLTVTEVAPRGLASGERRTWLMVQRSVEGFYLHPVGLEVLVDHRALEPRLWRVQKLWYNGRYFASAAELARLHASGAVPVVPLPPHPDETGFSTFAPRGSFSAGPSTARPGAKVCEPGGRSYALRGGHVLEYSGWRLAFRLRTSTGLQLLDVRFQGERVAYEVSVQEAIAFYGGASPASLQTKYIDVGWGMGSVTHELAPGVDCPEGATFVDAHHFYDAAGPVRFPRALCAFELPTGVPLRRHFDSDYRGGAHFYAGLEGHALVLRTTSTVYNYDYIWDFLLYPNGVLEAKVHATGYLHAAFYTPEGLRYGNRLQEHVLGNIHTHLVHYKVDLDVAGVGNNFETLDVALENGTVPWEPSRPLVQPRLASVPRLSERQAAFPFGEPLPRYLLFGNPQKPNRWGHRRSYRLQLASQADRVLPRGWHEERGVTWSRYPLAVTQQHDNEDTSSSLYIQNDPWNPTVTFENFLQNDENLENQDLVAWVTVGFLHIPHAEDIPTTTTPGNAVGFYLRPFNFFEEDPSVASQRPIIVRPSKSGEGSGMQILRWTPADPMPCVSKEPFSYNGTYREV